MGRRMMAVRRLFRSFRRPTDTADPTGIDPDLIQDLCRPVDSVCRAWYGLDVLGMEHIPAGRALIVGNHNSGSMFIEAMGVAARVRLERPNDHWHGLAHDAIIGLPVVGPWLYRLGALRAGHDSADAAFDLGRKVIVFPGGNREAYRPWSRRYQVELDGRLGFVKLAIRHQVPIVPAVFVGGHSGFVVLHEGRRFARLVRAHRWLRSDTWPLMLCLPFGVFWGPGMHLPLPVKCTTQFLAPVDPTEFGDLDDPTTVDRVHAEVVDRMQVAMDALASERRRRPWPLRR